MNRTNDQWIGRIFFSLIFFILLKLSTLATLFAQDKPLAITTFYVAPLSKKINLPQVQTTLAQPSDAIQSLYNEAVLRIEEKLEQRSLHFFISEKKIWLNIAIRKGADTSQFLQDLLETLARKYQLPPPEPGQITDRVSIPLQKSDGTIDMAGMRVPNRSLTEYFDFISRQEVSKKWRTSPEAVILNYRNGQFVWEWEHQGRIHQAKAIHYRNQASSPPHSPKNSLIPLLLFFLPFTSLKISRQRAFRFFLKLSILGIGFILVLLVRSAAAQNAVVYSTNLTGWDNVLNAVHTKYPNYQDVEFNNLVSEKLSDLQALQPEFVLIIAEPQTLTPAFLDDIDQTMCQIDADKFTDVVWSLVTGFSPTDALNLLNAPDASNDHTLVLANPDGSLKSSGYSGTYLTQILTDDDTHLGNAQYYVNTTTTENPNCTASNLQQEINNDLKDCIIFLDHGNTSIWGLKSGECFSGNGSSLRTYDGAFYQISNNRNCLVDAEACLTMRIHDKRSSQWKPWETLTSNVTASANNSIALAWMKSSPGFYIGNYSVSYGNTHIMLALLNVMKFDYTPAEAIMITKNIYNYIIGAEVADNNVNDGDTNDFLRYTERSLCGLGDPRWKIDLNGDPPDYAITYTDQTQQDALPENPRGWVYVGQEPKWRGTVNLRVNEEIVLSDGFFGAEEMESPFLFIPVENVAADTTNNYISFSDECAVIGGIFKMQGDVRQIELANGNPSDTEKLYNHLWRGKGDAEAVECFKCSPNTNELVWFVAAGITDADADDNFEWRINQNYSKSFDVFYWVKPVKQHVRRAIAVDGNTRQVPVEIRNTGQSTISEVIAKVPIPTLAHSLVLSPTENVHDLIKVNEGDNSFAEFTINSIESGAVHNYTLQYELDSQEMTHPIITPGVPYYFVVNEDTLAEMIFSTVGTLDSVRVTAFLDSFPENCPGNPSAMPVKRYFQINGFGGTGFTVDVWLYYHQADFDSSDIDDENSLYAARWHNSAWETYPALVDPVRNRVHFTTSAFSIWGIGGENGSLPVELSSFTASVTVNGILLNWRTASETQNMGFEIYRSLNNPENWYCLASYKNSPALRGAGTTAQPREYHFHDQTAPAGGTFWYKLVDFEYSGKRTEHTPVSVTSSATQLPQKYELVQNYPNPFNATTVISFRVKQLSGNAEGTPQNVRLVIYDVAGREVTKIVNGDYQPGNYSVSWNGTDQAGNPVAAGMYFYQLQINNFKEIKKMILLY